MTNHYHYKILPGGRIGGTVRTAKAVGLLIIAVLAGSIFLGPENLLLLFPSRIESTPVSFLIFPSMILGCIAMVKLSQSAYTIKRKAWAIAGIASAFILFLFLISSLIMFIKGCIGSI